MKLLIGAAFFLGFLTLMSLVITQGATVYRGGTINDTRINTSKYQNLTSTLNSKLSSLENNSKTPGAIPGVTDFLNYIVLIPDFLAINSELYKDFGESLLPQAFFISDPVIRTVVSIIFVVIILAIIVGGIIAIVARRET